MGTFLRTHSRPAVVALALTVVLSGCLGDDAGSNDPEANDPDVLNPEAP